MPNQIGHIAICPKMLGILQYAQFRNMPVTYIPQNHQSSTQPEPPEPNNNPRQPALPKRNVSQPRTFKTKSFNNRQRTAPNRNMLFRSSSSRQQVAPTQNAETPTHENAQPTEETSNLRSSEETPELTKTNEKAKDKKKDQGSQLVKDIRKNLHARGILPRVLENKKSNNAAGTSTEKEDELRRSQRTTKGVAPKKFMPRWN